MNYRNIDEDINLYKGAKRYWSNQITRNQLYWVLGDKGYSEKEVDKSIEDYYLIHIRPEILINYILYFWLFVIILLILLYKFG
jgi:hypothetical protein